LLAESEGFEVTELLAGRARWRQSSGLPEAIRPVPAVRAAGRDPAKRWPWRESRSPNPPQTSAEEESEGFEVTAPPAFTV